MASQFRTTMTHCVIIPNDATISDVSNDHNVKVEICKAKLIQFPLPPKGSTINDYIFQFNYELQTMHNKHCEQPNINI